MRNPNEKLQVRLFANRIEGTVSGNKLINAYNEATKTPYSYLLIDMCQKTPQVLKYKTDIFNDSYQIVFI